MDMDTFVQAVHRGYGLNHGRLRYKTYCSEWLLCHVGLCHVWKTREKCALWAWARHFI